MIELDKDLEQPSLSSIQQRLKITVLGKGFVGKSSLSYCFANNKVLTKNDRTIEDRYIIAVMVDNIPCEIEILDTAGQDEYQNLIDGWINFGDGFMIVFALNDKESLEFASNRHERVLKITKNNKIPLVLVGNKKDLEEERVFEKEEMEKIADNWKCDYIETSAINKSNCRECFLTLARKIIANRKTKKSNCLRCIKCSIL